MKRALLFIVVCFIGIGIGSAIATYIFFGVLTLLGFAFMVESIRPLKWFVSKTTGFIDVLVFTITIIATINLGVTITASLTVAGLGYTMIYAPYVRYTIKKKTTKRKF